MGIVDCQRSRSDRLKGRSDHLNYRIEKRNDLSEVLSWFQSPLHGITKISEMATEFTMSSCLERQYVLNNEQEGIGRVIVCFDVNYQLVIFCSRSRKSLSIMWTTLPSTGC